jgi:hypothetical protein
MKSHVTVSWIEPDGKGGAEAGPLCPMLSNTMNSLLSDHQMRSSVENAS